MIRFILAILCLVLCSAVGQTQDPLAPHPLEPSDTSSPAETLNSLINSCNQLQNLVSSGAVSGERTEELLPTRERILDCLDLSELPKELRETAGIESALFLKEVLDRIDLPADDAIPELNPAADEASVPLRWQIPRTRIEIARVEKGPRQGAYLFTPETVRRASKFYSMVKPLPYRSEGRSVSPGLYDAYIAATKKQPTRSADTSSPRGTLTLFMDACNELKQMILKERFFDRNEPEFHRLAQRIISCLDTSQLPEYAREYFDAEAAVCLKEVLDRVPLPPDEAIPGIESVEVIEGSKPLTRWQVPHTQIVISRMEEGPRRGEYLFSARTVSRAPELFEKSLSQPYRTSGRGISDGLHEWWLSSPGNPTVAGVVDRLPPSFQQRYFGLAIWQWTGMILVVPICLAAMFLLFHWARVRGEYERERSLIRYWLLLAVMIVAVLVPLGFKHIVWEYLTVRGTAIYVINFCADLVLLFGVLILVVGGSSRAAESLIALPQIAPASLDANLIVFRVLGIVAAVIIFLEGGHYLGFPLTTLIASAGIGGLAIALSAQGLIGGLFGTVTVLLDKPYRVGERIMVKGHDGVVEDIGLRSTKIRALNDHVISIPNDQIADAEIENIGKRKHIRRSSELHIPLDTPRCKVEAALECIRDVLENHEGMDPEFPPRVYFSDITPEAFTIKLIYWYAPPDYWAFKAFSEKVNLKLFAAFEKQGIQFSLPLRHTYWKTDDQQGPLEIAINDQPEQQGNPKIAPLSD